MELVDAKSTPNHPRIVEISVEREETGRAFVEYSIRSGTKCCDTRALIDQGSTISLIDEAHYDDFIGWCEQGENPFETGKIRDIKIKGVSVGSPFFGRTRVSRKRVNLSGRFKFGPEDRLFVYQDFYVVPDLKHSMILGADFLIEHEASLVNKKDRSVLTISTEMIRPFNPLPEDTGMENDPEPRDRTPGICREDEREKSDEQHDRDHLSPLLEENGESDADQEDASDDTVMGAPLEDPSSLEESSDLGLSSDGFVTTLGQTPERLLPTAEENIRMLQGDRVRQRLKKFLRRHQLYCRAN